MKGEIFQRQVACPVCGSVNRSRIEIGLARDKQPSYLVALAESLKMPYEEIIGPLVDWKCDTCSTVYLDPSLSRGVISHLYTEAAPIHNYGWFAFTRKLLGENSKDKSLYLLQDLLAREGVEFDKYLEVGCPFLGFQLAFADRGDVCQRFIGAFTNQDKIPDASRRRILRHALRLERMLKRIMSGYFRIWLWRQNLRRSASAEIESNTLRASELSLLTEFSGNRWSVECRAFGSSCISMSRVTLGTNLISIGHMGSLPNGHFDLAGIFNSLDHSDSPLELLELVAKKAKCVLVTAHSVKDAYLQHRFAFSSDTIPRICSQLGLHCQDLSGELGKIKNAPMAYLIRPRI